MKILVTGNTGYIGAVLCKKLLEEGFEVIGIDAGFYKGCNFIKENYNLKQITKDIRNIGKEDFEGVEAVIHLAALSNDPMGALLPELTSVINYRASMNLARLAKDCKVERFIFSSSCSVYGIAGDQAITEDGVLNPITEYAKSKVDSEIEISKLADGIFSPVFLRNATVYGVSPMLRVDLVVNNLVGWAFTTGKIRLMSDGSPWRPLIHIQDICRAFIAVLKAPRGLIHNQVFNIGQNSQNYRVKDIVDTIKNVMPEAKIEYTGEHGVDTRTYRVNFSKFNRALNNYFKPSWNIEEGVKELFDAYKTNNLSYGDFDGNKFIRLKRIRKLLEEGKLDKNLFWKKEMDK